MHIKVTPGLECWSYVTAVKQRWRVLPDHMMVMEFSGKGDPFFGGSACDLALGKCGRLLTRAAADSKTAVFSTIEEAHRVASKIPNRRPGTTLGIVPVWNTGF